MVKRNQKTIDVKSIIKLFGGKHQIVSDYEKILKTVITIKAIEKWLERASISTDNVLNLKTIAERRGIVFAFESHIK